MQGCVSLRALGKPGIKCRVLFQVLSERFPVWMILCGEWVSCAEQQSYGVFTIHGVRKKELLGGELRGAWLIYTESLAQRLLSPREP